MDVNKKLNNKKSTISYRSAAFVEYPQGVPLAHSFGDYKAVMGGQLLLMYEPPIVEKNSIHISVVGKVRGTQYSFSGPLLSEFPGDIFKPSPDLITSIQKVVKTMNGVGAPESNEVISAVIEELLSYSVINAPVKSIYETIRLEYPAEFRAMNMDYKRRRQRPILEDIDAIQSEQKSYRFGKVSGFIRNAIKKQDVVEINRSMLKADEGLPKYKQMQDFFNVIKPINGKYIVFDDPKNGEVQLVGKKEDSKTGLAKSDFGVPLKYLKEQVDHDASDDDDITEEEKRRYNIGPKKRTVKPNNEKVAPAAVSDDEFKSFIVKNISTLNVQNKDQMANYIYQFFKKNAIPLDVVSNLDVAKQHIEPLRQLYLSYINSPQLEAPPFLKEIIKKIGQ